MNDTNEELKMSLPRNRKELRERWNAGEHFEFFLFYGHKPPFQGVNESCLSQWFERDFTIDGVEYSTAEHWMMAEKARLFKDDLMLESILDSAGPREAKAFGRRVRNFDQSVWEEHRFEIVKNGNRTKFSQNEDLKEFLLNAAVSAESREKWMGKVAEPRESYSTGSSESDSVETDQAEKNLLFVQPDESALDRSLAKPKNSNVILVEAAGRDMIWGIGLGKQNPKSQDPNLWRGRNLLGFALTQVREELWAKQNNSIV